MDEEERVGQKKKKHAERGVRQAIYVVISLARSLARSLSPSLSPFLFYCPPVFCPSFPSFSLTVTLAVCVVFFILG